MFQLRVWDFQNTWRLDGSSRSPFGPKPVKFLIEFTFDFPQLVEPA
jgi:hypothetical protein